VAQGDDDPFPGTIWTANYLGESITVFEPMESGGVAIEDGDGMPGSYTLYGNYPNPFDVATTVVFDLPTAANVRLEVFDVLGRRALALPEVAVPAGSNRQLEIQGGELSAGAYVYRLTIRQGADTRILSGGMTVAR